MQIAESHKRRILVTGVAGFIGFHLVRRLLHDYADAAEITGIDNLSDIADSKLKLDRLRELGVEIAAEGETKVTSECYPGLVFKRLDLADNVAVAELFAAGRFDLVVHLAARASARYSVVNPRAYVESNITGFLNVLEGCRQSGVKHLVFASSSSVYGVNDEAPYREDSDASQPVSFYAATKRSNELMAHSYAAMYGLRSTALRFFSVYGPWGRPDMAPYLFIDAIMHGRSIKVYNNGDMYRDFTFVDDVIEGIVRVSELGESGTAVPFRIFNIGNSSPVRLLDFVSEIESATGECAEIEMLPMQPGDVYSTCSDSSALKRATGFFPSTPISEGVVKTVEWFKEYNRVEI